MVKVLLLTDFSSGYSRSLLKGVVQYGKAHGPWAFYRMPLYFRELHGDEGVVKWAKQWGADAIIAQLRDVKVETLQKLKIPIIVQNYKDRYEGISNLTGDYFGTGAMAADFFLRKGYKCFAYYGFKDAVWMRERGEGFKSGAENRGYPVYLFDEGGMDEKWIFNEERVRQWLMELPKPVALFSCDDSHAIQITEICKMSGISIPEEIAILGVDNDELICNISDPSLSSIELDVENGGFEAGRLLHQFIEKKKKPPVDIVIKPIRVVMRSSTERFAVSDKYIEGVLKYINDQYVSSLSVKDIVRLVPFSRRVLETSFKEEIGMTVYHYIQQVRVEKFCDLLVSSDLSLTEAATCSGFNDYKNVSRTFVRLKSMTPFQYRKKYRMKEPLKD
jgi:LacI family transcriptional regulator